jgi:hypothetical protein
MYGKALERFGSGRVAERMGSIDGYVFFHSVALDARDFKDKKDHRRCFIQLVEYRIACMLI